MQNDTNTQSQQMPGTQHNTLPGKSPRIGFVSMTGVLLSAVLLAGCASDPIGDLSSEAPVLTSKDKQLHSSVMSSYDSWKGTPYRLGGNGRNGIDCSAFVQQVYQEFNQRYPNSLYSSPLPRTTSHQWAASSSVSNQNAKVGDLVFFKTGIKQRHVGVYLGNYDFVHASTSRGVIISSLTTPYWRTHFEGFRRP